MSTGYDGARIVPVATGTKLFDAVFALAEANKATLGMLKPAAWKDYTDEGRVLALVETDAASEETLAGFVAFRLPRAEVRLTQLAVAPTARRHGVGHALVTELSRRYASRRGSRRSTAPDHKRRKPTMHIVRRITLAHLGVT